MNNDLKPDTKKIRITAQIFHILSEIVELYPQYSIVHHLATITRRKGSDKEFYYWTEEEFLKRIEAHKEELEGDEFMTTNEDED